MLTIVGGLYIEKNLSKNTEEILGSGGRAAIASSSYGLSTHFHCYATFDTIKAFKRSFQNLKSFLIINPSITQNYISFTYQCELFDPIISYYEKLKPLNIQAPCILRFGMLETTAIVNGDYVIYDPQSTSAPESFSKNGSTAKHLAIILNEQESKAFIGFKISNIEAIIKEIFKIENAEIVIIKRGPLGAILYDGIKIQTIPVFPTKQINKLGSGDIFSAYFSIYWGLLKNNPLEASINASKAASIHCDRGIYPQHEAILSITSKGLYAANLDKELFVYLASPLFSTSELWLIEKIKGIFESYNINLFSPYHDVGLISNDNYFEIAQADLNSLEKCSAVLAVGNNFDPGTTFEIGYAKAIHKPVFIYISYFDPKDIVMFKGTGCYTSDNLVTIIYQTIWEIIRS